MFINDRLCVYALEEKKVFVRLAPGGSDKYKHGQDCVSKSLFGTKYKYRLCILSKKGVIGKIQIQTLDFEQGSDRKNTNTDGGQVGAGWCYRVSDTDGLH